MKIVSKYIQARILQALLLTLLIFSSLFFIILFIREISLIGIHNYTVLYAIIYVILQLPLQTFNFLPIICLFAVAIALLLVFNRNELIIIRSAGVGNYQITIKILQIVFLITIAGLLFHNYGALPLKKWADNFKNYKLNKSTQFGYRQGLQLKIDDNILLLQYFDGNNIYDVTRYHIVDGHIQQVMHAVRLSKRHDGWWANQVNTTSFHTDQLIHKYYESMRWNIDIDLNNFVYTASADTLTLQELWKIIFSNINHAIDLYYWEFLERILLPIITAFLIIVVLPLLLINRRVVNARRRLLAVGIIGITYYFSMKAIGLYSVIAQLSPLLLLVYFIFALLMFTMLLKLLRILLRSR